MDTHLRPRLAAEHPTRRKNLYIAQADDEVWKAAIGVARKRGVSLSSLVVEALADYLSRQEKEEN